MQKERLTQNDAGIQINDGEIFDTALNRIVDFDGMVKSVLTADVVLIGERHKNKRHHEIQRDVINALYRLDNGISVGLEMFDVTYQHILDAWRENRLSKVEFIEKSHWYANWRYDFDLYLPVFSLIKEKGIPMFALNIPSHIPPKILAGGVDNLFGEDKRHLTTCFPTENEKYMAGLKKIFSMHRLKNRNNFNYFYEAQCAWDAKMADAIIHNQTKSTMVVLVGAGHAHKNSGITEQIQKRSDLRVISVLLIDKGENSDPADADFFYSADDLMHKESGL